MKHWLIKESSILSTWNKRKVQQRKCQNLDCCTFDIDTSDQLVIFLICTSGLKICSIWSLICNFSSETFAVLLVLLGLGELRTRPDKTNKKLIAVLNFRRETCNQNPKNGTPVAEVTRRKENIIRWLYTGCRENTVIPLPLSIPLPLPRTDVRGKGKQTQIKLRIVEQVIPTEWNNRKWN